MASIVSYVTKNYMSRVMYDPKGRKYTQVIYDRDDNILDEIYLRDGDCLLDPRVYKVVHEKYQDANLRYFATFNGKSISPLPDENSGGGVCEGCGMVGPFFVNGGKEYCGICNEFYDTYAFIRQQRKASTDFLHEVQNVRRVHERFLREGNWPMAKQSEQEMYRLEELYNKALLEEAEMGGSLTINPRAQRVNKAQNDYIRKALMNRPPDYDA